MDFEVDNLMPGRKVGAMMVEDEQHHEAILHSVRSFKARVTTSGWDSLPRKAVQANHPAESAARVRLVSLRVHVDRAAGGHCHHCHPGGAAAAGADLGKREGPAHLLPKRTEAAWPGRDDVWGRQPGLGADGHPRRWGRAYDLDRHQYLQRHQAVQRHEHEHVPKPGGNLPVLPVSLWLGDGLQLQWRAQDALAGPTSAALGFSAETHRQPKPGPGLRP